MPLLLEALGARPRGWTPSWRATVCALQLLLPPFTWCKMGKLLEWLLGGCQDPWRSSVSGHLGALCWEQISLEFAEPFLPCSPWLSSLLRWLPRLGSAVPERSSLLLGSFSAGPEWGGDQTRWGGDQTRWTQEKVGSGQGGENKRVLLYRWSPSLLAWKRKTWHFQQKRSNSSSYRRSWRPLTWMLRRRWWQANLAPNLARWVSRWGSRCPFSWRTESKTHIQLYSSVCVCASVVF